MALRALLLQIASGYQRAATEPFTEHPMAIALRRELPDAIRRTLDADGEGFTYKGSAGQGIWAAVPWAAVFEPSITDTATQGYYPVYLFNVPAGRIHLSLNQGTTAVYREFGSLKQAVLRDRAAIIRLRLADFAQDLPEGTIDLPDERGLGGDYAAGHALGVSYDVAGLPSEDQLAADVRRLVHCYRALIFRGGLNVDSSPAKDRAATPNGIDEERRYSMHRRIERNPRAARAAKKFHGVSCQACMLNFADRYGDVGEGFIEAHHLRPIASLTEGTKVRYDVAADFAVLCANCHRMIHRLPDPSDLQGLIATIR